MIIENAGLYGDMRKFVVTVNGKDITNAVTAVNIFQDVFSPTNTAIINIVDTENLLMRLPINVGAKVTVEYATKVGSKEGDGSASWSFMIYRIGEKEITNQEIQSYVIFVADKAFLNNQTKRIYRSYANLKCAAAVKKVVEEYLGGELVSHTDDSSIHFIATGWTPFRTIAWLSKIATKQQAADYAFFQYPDGKFAFKSFETLYSSQAESCGIKFEMHPTNTADEKHAAEYDYCTSISQYSFEHFDGLTNLAGGYYQNKLAVYDMMAKKWTVKNFKFGDDNAADKAKLKDDNGLFLGAEDSNISFVPKHPGMFKTPAYSDKADTWQTSRKSAILKFDQEKLVIQLPGGGKTAKWFGKNCEVDLPAQDSFRRERYDKQRRGRYLITAINHSLNKDAYLVTIELCKKRLES